MDLTRKRVTARPPRGRRGAATLLVLAGSMHGCTGIEPAMLGVAASASSMAMTLGKARSAWIATFDQVIAAGEASLSDLGLSITRSAGSVDEGYWKITAIDDQRDEYKITVRRDTHRLIRFEVDVGWFGSKAVGRLLVKRMGLHLIDLGARLGDPAALDWDMPR